jgi:anti-sigma B factor antagonist
MAVTSRIDLKQMEGVPVVRFRDRQLFDDRTVREVAEQVFAATPAAGPICMILDFTGVEQISSSLLGKLILLQRRVDASGGKLRLCEMSNVVRSVFKTSNLDRLFGIDRDAREALEAFS